MIQLKGLGNQQTLGGNRRTAVGSLEGLEKHALMGSMLVDQYQTIFRLANNVGIVKLADDPERGKVFFGPEL